MKSSNWCCRKYRRCWSRSLDCKTWLFPFLFFLVNLLRGNFYVQFHILWHRDFNLLQSSNLRPYLILWFNKGMLMPQCQTFVCMGILLQWTLLISKEDTQVSYLELMKLLQCIQLLGNYILVECQIMKISNISVLLCNKLWNVSTELFFYPVMLQLRTPFFSNVSLAFISEISQAISFFF